MRWACLPLLAALAACGGKLPPANAPEAVLVAPSYCDLGTTMTLDGAGSSDLDGDIVLYRFVIADGSAVRESTEPSITAVCGVAGLIEVMLEVVDARGLADQVRSVVSVRRP
jgi:hypothetical protein